MIKFFLHFTFLLALCISEITAQNFVHPGINQSAEDLTYMRQQVLKSAQPWKDAFDRLKADTDLSFAVKPFAHVKRGPYGRPNIGGDDLSKGARMAYDCALLWYITQDNAYAEKAIEIINAWSTVLWDFDYNDAKLLAGWTGHYFCNAAEILRYTNSGWKKNDIDNFVNMLMTAYYPVMRFYYPQANGNWDGAIIHSIMAIGIFTDNREMFNNALNHFLYGPVNGGIFKYIYPSGQCQETMRDQGHVQLGLGEFAGVARIAYTQGVDLFSIGNNRLALGYEFTASFLLGEKPFSYGVISERAKGLRDDYEYVYRHYTAMGLELPFTKIAADSMRHTADQSILTAFRAPGKILRNNNGTPAPGKTAYPAGALASPSYELPKDPIRVSPGESIQDALNASAGTGRWVIAKAGLHTLPTTLQIPSGVTLAGEGVQTKIFLDPEAKVRDAIVNATDDLHDVTIRDLVIEGALRPEPPSDPNSVRSYRNVQGNRGGIILSGPHEGAMKNITLLNLTVQNCTYNGVFISGASGLVIQACDLNENGSYVVPGPKLQHNLLLTHCSEVRVEDSRLDTSPYGSGLALSHSTNAQISRCEIARNGYYGVIVSESTNVTLISNFVEANDRTGIMVEFLHKGSESIALQNNTVQFNNGYGLEAYAVRKAKVSGNTYTTNRDGAEKISGDKSIIMK